MQQAVQDDAEASVTNEPGCLQFDVFVDRDHEPAREMLFEVYIDRDAFDAHLETPRHADVCRLRWQVLGFGQAQCAKGLFLKNLGGLSSTSLKPMPLHQDYSETWRSSSARQYPLPCTVLINPP